MNPIYSTSGEQITGMNEYEIATGTAISLGQVVKLTANKVVVGLVGETSAILGIAAEAHSGAADVLNQRSAGLKIKVYDSPNQVFESPVPRTTATSGSATTHVDTALAVFADSDFVGGKLKLVSKVAGSTNTDPIGTIYEITVSVGATKTLTFAAAGGAITAGDVFEIYPPVGFAKGNLDTGISKLVLTATAALPVEIVGYDTNRGMLRHKAALHQLGNKKA